MLGVAACSSTSALPEGEQLFTGLKPIQYENYEECDHAEMTKEEMEYVLASAPNGALFGSSYYRSPFPVRLWIWNAFSQDSSRFSQWMTRAFGTRPKLLSQVNPQLRSQVAENQLKKFGYFNSLVTYKDVQQNNPKKAKIAYTVNLGHLWTIDSIDYRNFPEYADSLIDSTRSEALIKRGDAFSVSSLENERQRITSLFRNNGYYYYENGYSSYLADTLNVPGKVQLQFRMADSLDNKALHKWYIGKMRINFRKQYNDQLKDSLIRRRFSLYFNGSRPPIRTGVLLRQMKLRSNQLYSYENELESKQGIQGTGLFTSTTFNFTPRNNSRDCDTLDLDLDLMFDKPYDLYIEANAKGKTTGRIGPELVLGLTKRNAFRGGEKLDINLHGSYEWYQGNSGVSNASDVNSWEYGADAAIVFPRILTPRSLFYSYNQNQRKKGKRRRRYNYYSVPTTTLRGAFNVLNRAGYYRRHVVSGELTYDWQTSAQSSYSWSPLILTYEYMNMQTDTFKVILQDKPYLKKSMEDQFVPKMSFTYRYNSPVDYRNPITWETTVSEAGNLLSLGYAAFGKQWNDTTKTMFKNHYAQFLKVETDFAKKWSMGENASLVAHVNAGVIWTYGNSIKAPYYEQFYIGGANSVRAFNVRSIGPGKYYPIDKKHSYIDQTGDVKLLMNLEYRPKLFGDLYGAIFLDAGNVWNLHDDEVTSGKFQVKDFFRQMALGTGVGVRYDLGMFVIRVDWGIGLHLPYETNKHGFYNITSFKEAQCLHLAVGYPF